MSGKYFISRIDIIPYIRTYELENNYVHNSNNTISTYIRSKTSFCPAFALMISHSQDHTDISFRQIKVSSVFCHIVSNKLKGTKLTFLSWHLTTHYEYNDCLRSSTPPPLFTNNNRHNNCASSSS